MSITIKLPTQLRPAAAGQSAVAVDASDVRTALQGLCQSAPELTPRLFDDSGELRRFVNVFLKGEDIRFLSGLDTAVSSGDELTILPAVAGGAA